VKDRQSLVIFLVILGVVLLAGVFFKTQMEIAPYITWTEPSKEVKDNEYLAFERWLEQLGFTLTFSTIGSVETVLNAKEKTVFIQNSRFNWTQYEQLYPWIENGGHLIVSIDTEAPGEELEHFMKELGVKKRAFGYRYKDKDEEDAAEPEPDSGKDTFSELPREEVSPALGWEVFFSVTANPETDKHIFVMGNSTIKLVKVEQEQGWVVFTGQTPFLKNYNIQSDTLDIQENKQRKPNVELAGDLFLDTPEKAVLFIRQLSHQRHLLGLLAERGNPMALGISVALLVVIGFWMVIPSFGRNKPEPQRPGKPLRERFLSEGTFLAKYHALGKYIDVYRKELEQRKGIETAPVDGTALTVMDFLREQKRLTKQLEEL
jgi:hypothetical protein